MQFFATFSQQQTKKRQQTRNGWKIRGSHLSWATWDISSSLSFARFPLETQRIVAVISPKAHTLGGVCFLSIHWSSLDRFDYSFCLYTINLSNKYIETSFNTLAHIHITNHFCVNVEVILAANSHIKVSFCYVAASHSRRYIEHFHSTCMLSQFFFYCCVRLHGLLVIRIKLFCWTK